MKLMMPGKYFFFKVYFVLYALVSCLHIIYVYHMYARCPWSLEEALHPLQLELGKAMSHHESTGNQTQGPLQD